jgi:hypothetical protein
MGCSVGLIGNEVEEVFTTKARRTRRKTRREEKIRRLEETKRETTEDTEKEKGGKLLPSFSPLFLSSSVYSVVPLLPFESSFESFEPSW